MTLRRKINKNKQGSITDSSDMWLAQGVDLTARRIDLLEEINAQSCGIAIRAIRCMVAEDDTSPIHIYINTQGGVVYDGFALYDVMRECPAPIYTYAQGRVMSMGTIIFLGGDVRHAGHHTSFMWHSIAGGQEGKLFELVDYVKETNRLWECMLQVYASRAREKLGWWRRWLKHQDRYGDINKAVELGFVHFIIDPKKED